MSESLVDLSYRGLVLGKRIKLTQVRATAGFLEMPNPMPVGTTIAITAEDGTVLEATVGEVREQITGADRAPGMTVTPKLDADAARTWWKQRVTVPDEPHVAELPKADADGKVTVRSRRMSEGGVPELIDDGRNTAVVPVIDDAAATVIGEPIAADAAGDPATTDPSMPRVSAEIAAVAETPIVDDGKRTMMMDAVDLAALGLDPSASSGQMPAVKDEDSGPAPSGGKKKKKKKR